MDTRTRIIVAVASSVGAGIVGWFYGVRVSRLRGEWREEYFLRLTRAFLRELSESPCRDSDISERAERARSKVPPPEMSRELRFSARIFRSEDWVESLNPLLLGMMLLSRLKDADCIEEEDFTWVLTERGRSFLEQC